MALTDRIQELERKYGELFTRERDLNSPEPQSIQARRQRFIDYLFDEVLSQEDIFESFSAVGSTGHKKDGLVLKYQVQPGYNSMHEEAGTVSHYQFMAFRQQTNFSWLPDFLMLRDKNTSQVRLYMVRHETSYTPLPTIGSDGDLELSYEMPYQRISSGGGFDIDRGGMQVKEVTRSELCDPHFVFGIEKVIGQEGAMFDAFYRGLQEFAKKNLQKMNELRGKVQPEQIDRTYAALQAIAGKT